MGHSNWSDTHYSDKVRLYSASGKTHWDFSAATLSKPLNERKAHKDCDPKGIKFRESRDSAEHPNSNAVAVMFDCTGSMRLVPTVFQKNLCKLMGLLLRKSYLPDPQVFVGCFGDATCDRVPLQITQFEAGIEVDDQLEKLFLEGGGGGQNTESYELAMYWLARHTSIDCWEKRKKKGYAFLTGDERSYDRVSARQVADLIGDGLQSDIPTADIVKELQRSYEVYFIIPGGTCHYEERWLLDHWTNFFGQNVLRLDNPEGICELIATTIGLAEGVIDTDSAKSDLVEFGSSNSVIESVSKSLAVVGANANNVLSLKDTGLTTL